MKPFVHLNCAMTVDGKIASKDSPLKISGAKDLVRVHELRKTYDAIMVGINTVLVDNPRLTVHKVDSVRKDNPLRIIIDSNAKTPLDSRVLNDDADTIIFVSKIADKDRVSLLSKKCDVITCGEKLVDLKKAMSILYDKGVETLLLEGGSTLNFSMLKDKLVDKISICIGSIILGGINSKTFVDGDGFSIDKILKLELTDVKKIDEDILLTYITKYS